MARAARALARAGLRGARRSASTSARRPRARLVDGRPASPRSSSARGAAYCRLRDAEAARPRASFAESVPGLYQLVSTSGASTSSTTRPSSPRSTRSPTRRRWSTSGSSTASSRGSRAASSRRSGTVLRAFQTGVVQAYAAVDGGRPRRRSAGSSCAAAARGARSMRERRDRRGTSSRPRRASATSYRWDADADGKPTTDVRRDARSVELDARAGRDQASCVLEVKNAFGRDGDARPSPVDARRRRRTHRRPPQGRAAPSGRNGRSCR